jgi:hypothetical protein
LPACLIFEGACVLHIVDDSVGQAPLDEVELGHGRRQALKLDALGPTKGIEELL